MPILALFLKLTHRHGLCVNKIHKYIHRTIFRDGSYGVSGALGRDGSVTGVSPGQGLEVSSQVEIEVRSHRRANSPGRE